VTHLRQLMLEELRRRNFAETTIRTYLHGVEHFSRILSVDSLIARPSTFASIRQPVYQFKFSPNTVGLAWHLRSLSTSRY